ncbi:hypothetical protein TCAL_04893 [Tigriopus californicus]|uniref:Dolichyl-diphosphooligosaccharide--protein glycosyltransferase subunit 2 n=1 Tax=Tigriopus californicus TaxID=6832 RepID=A0A553NDU1_TIGCA|nr:dolichyl-diphosphooligosaccharide--protein glycosyltransferase subunit 2-like [Tigriopus californicus]TRY63519.1 hypothetical protein TCAL_04893 [Tigriopus californicus]|eukprot:TCALIF_04893-PA protein Name:"Similar to RPN2 Dolichyl-diphosphooligosaccharide--protein glycosyltransferase subunit 2 (Pongo abelii)" AED:0.01 eAED:0.01 QI:128/1/1/1/1/1/2/328/638
MRFLCLFMACLSLSWVGHALSPSSFFSTTDKSRLQGVFESALKAGMAEKEDFPLAVLGLTLLGQTVADAKGVCQKMQTAFTGNSLNRLYLISQAGQDLKCGLKAAADVSQTLKSALTSSDSSVANLFYASLTLKALGEKLDAAALVSALQAGLKKDDSVANIGFAFQVASVLEGKAAQALFDRVEDVVVQADEIDGKMLQFEGGVSTTNIILSGIYKMADKFGKAPGISKMQASKFANYFLSRKSVQTCKGGYHLVDALTTLSRNKYHIPVAITLGEQSTVVSETSPKVQVRISNVMGQTLGAMSVKVDSAMRQTDGHTILSKTKMAAVSGQEGVFEVDMMSAKPGRGFYELTVTATPNKADARLAGNEGAVLLVKALGSVEVTQAEIGIVDADQGTAAKLNPVAHPSKSAKVLEADHHHKVVFKFALTDKVSKEKIRAHQVFVRLAHVQTKAEIIFVAEPDSKSVYKFDLDVKSKAKEFGGKSGKYEIQLIVGDAVISNPILWSVADINLKFQEVDGGTEERSAPLTGPKPEITHLFRQPEARPPSAVSNLFTILCLLPFLVMLGLWMKLGVNISAFPFSLSALGFHLGLGSIFGLYYYFWLQLNMFTTVKYLFMVGVVTFLCGNAMLVKIAKDRKH